MSPFYPPGRECEGPDDDRPHFTDPKEIARHQAENLRRALGEELYGWLEEQSENHTKS